MEAKQLRAIVIDDEPHAINALSGLIKNYTEDVEVVGSASSALQGLKLITTHQPDIVFLDINMPGGSGIELIEALPERNFCIIFTTASADFALQALKNHATDYLLKPIDIDELIVAVEKVRKKKNEEKKKSLDKLALPTMQGVKMIQVNKIIYIEAEDNYTHFMVEGEKSKLTISKTLKEFEDLLGDENFYRIHQSYIINLHHLDSYIRGRGGQVLMKNGTLLDVSIRKKDGLLSRLLP